MSLATKLNRCPAEQKVLLLVMLLLLSVSESC